MKTKILIIIAGLMACLNPIFAQFSNDDVNLNVKGLSENHSEKFKANKTVFIESLNSSNLPASIKPLELEINYENNQGIVNLIIEFAPDKIYSEGSRYKRHGNQYRFFGKGVSFYFHHQLMVCLSEYKFAVAREDFPINKEIADFNSALTLEKPNGDKMKVYAYNQIGSGPNGLYPYYFYSNVDIQIAGKTYTTDCKDSKKLNDSKMFFVKDLEKLNGQKTGAYYFLQIL